ncbi:MAG: PP2C family protein-serine/threonine phosphatase [Phycisphaerales bacterium]|nr:PP2C family protein-serine/threonine phosphatase [Phycisphaerales bacterium]
MADDNSGSMSGPASSNDATAANSSPAPASATGAMGGTWEERLLEVDGLMREMSMHSDPQKMVAAYGLRVRKLFGNDGVVSMSRRNMTAPNFRITRSSTWKEQPDPWKEQHKLPVLDRGLLGRLLFDGKPVVINDLTVDADDPSAPYLAGMGSLLAIPHYENGEVVNMVCSLIKRPNGFVHDRVPEAVWLSSMFGRATSSLVLSQKLAESNEALDREMRTVAEIQRSLLPTSLPTLPGLEFAAHYQTSKNAGGDYYDFFDLEGGRVGMLIADVSGHGTPAAVLMAIMHAIAHVTPTDRHDPAKFVTSLNQELSRRYTLSSGSGSMFVTAFYAVYDPKSRMMTYCSAGHNPPRLRVGFVGDHGPVLSIDGARGLPLGVVDDAEYESAEIRIDPGDALVLYTDGITETFAPDSATAAASGTPRPPREMFGTDRLDEILARRHSGAQGLLQTVLSELDTFSSGQPPADDRTMIVITGSTAM